MDNFQNNLFLNIEFTITEAINEFSKIVAKEYDLDPNVLKEIWKNVSGNIEFSTSTLNRADTDTLSVASSSKSLSSSKSKKVYEETCCYKITRGPKKGEICDKERKFGEYCTYHKKYNTTDDSSSVAKSVKSVCTTTSEPIKKSVDKVLRKNKDLNMFWHADSKMVFKSKTERIVIGKENNGVVEPLTDEDKLVCETYGFRMEEEKESNE